MDLIAVWPNNLDYPLFRRFIKQNLGRFSKVIISMTEENMGIDFTPFLLESMSESFILQPEQAEGDWRQQATTKALLLSDSEWVWFIEQDFFIKDIDKFMTLTSRPDLDAIGFVDKDRLHPACLMVKREAMKRTSMDFAANPPHWDHFGHFTQDLMTSTKWAKLQSLGLEEGRDWYHHAGLSQNYKLTQQGLVPNYNIQNFLVYNANSRTDLVDQDERYIDLTHKAEKLLSAVKDFI